MSMLQKLNQVFFNNIFNFDLKTYDDTLKKEAILDLKNTIRIPIARYVDGEYFISSELKENEMAKIKGIKNKRDVKVYLYSAKYRYIMRGKINFLKDANAIIYKIKELDFEDAFREERIGVNQKALAYENNKSNDSFEILLKNISYSGVFFETSQILDKNINISLKDNDIEFEVEIVRSQKVNNTNQYGAIINKETINDIEKFENLLKHCLEQNEMT